VDAYLLDTNTACILWDEEHARHVSVRPAAEQRAGSGLLVSVVTLAEVEYGLLTAPDIDGLRQEAVRRNMAGYVSIPLDRHVVRYYADLRARLFKKYSPRDRRGRLTAKRVPDLRERTPDKQLQVQENDLWIAATALTRDLVLVTDDSMNAIRAILGSELRTERWA